MLAKCLRPVSAGILSAYGLKGNAEKYGNRDVALLTVSHTSFMRLSTGPTWRKPSELRRVRGMYGGNKKSSGVEDEGESADESDPSKLFPPELKWTDSASEQAGQLQAAANQLRKAGKYEFDETLEDDEDSSDMEVVQDELSGIISKTQRPSNKTAATILSPGNPSKPAQRSSVPNSVKVIETVEEDWDSEDSDEDIAAVSLDDPEFAGVGDLQFDENLLTEAMLDEEEAANLSADDADPVYSMTLGELIETAGIVPLGIEGSLDVVITGIQHDSREVVPGDLFVCCIGATVNGHLYAGEAVERGAVAVVVSEDAEVLDSVQALVVVENGNQALAAMAHCFYRKPSEDLLVVGVTGTNGKSTTSWLIRSMYQAMGLKSGMLGTIVHSIDKTELESSHTTPDALEVQRLMASMVHKHCEACVMEVSSHALAQGRTSHIDFDVAVFTNLTRDHLDFHHSMEAYLESKLKLFDQMLDPDRHRKVVNIDDPSAAVFLDRGNPQVPVVTYALKQQSADVYPLHVSLSLFETELVVRTPRGTLELSSGLLGRHNVSNILAAIAVGIAIEAPLEDIVRGIEDVDAVPGRCELIDEEQPFAVLVDYAHTPDALSRLIDTVRECGPSRVITVIGCGGDRDRGKRPIMCKIATDKSDVTIVTSDNPRNEDELAIIDDMLAGVGWSMKEYLSKSNAYFPVVPSLPNGHRLYVHDIRGVAVRAAVAMGKEGDAVIIAGKGHETYQIVKGVKDYYDDREECREALINMEELQQYFDTSELPWRLKKEQNKKK